MREFIRNFCKRKIAVSAFFVVITFILISLVGPFLCHYDPNSQNLDLVYQLPTLAHPLGTDNLGRDIATRMVYGARVSLLISFFGVLLGELVGIVLGVCSGYFGGIVDNIITAIVDILPFPGCCWPLSLFPFWATVSLTLCSPSRSILSPNAPVWCVAAS